MVNGIISDYGSQKALDTFDSNSPWSNAKVRLYSNNHTPTDSDTIANYTEATFTGYAAINMPAFPASTVTGHVASSTAASITFTLTSGSQAIYGVYITDNAGTNLLAAIEDPNAPVTLNTTVNTYTVTLTLTAQSAF